MTKRNRRESAGPSGDRLEPSTDEARYRALVENLPAVIYQVAPDDDRRTMYVSPHVETALGYTRDEYVGRHIAEFHADPPVIADICCSTR